MGIPRSFAIEYPERALQLVDAIEGFARQKELLGSFGLLAAAAVLTMPYERMKSTHFLHRAEDTNPLSLALRGLMKSSFLKAPFWQNTDTGAWRMSRIVKGIDDSRNWRDENDQHPFSESAANTIERRKADEVLRVIRNALAHGNIVYLDEHGFETPGRKLANLAFLSRYEEGPRQHEQSETYRVIITGEEEFLHFVRHWARWVSSLTPEIQMMVA